MSFAPMDSPVFSPSTLFGLLRGGSLVAGVEVSVILSEAHSFNSKAAQTALESGAQVTDHVIVDPNEVSVSFAMSNAGGGAEAARDALESFLRLRDERQLLELVTEHKVYENMVVTGVTPTHKAPHRGALQCTVKLRQVSFVQMQSAGRDPSDLNAGDGESGATGKTASRAVQAGRQDAPRAAL